MHSAAAVADSAVDSVEVDSVVEAEDLVEERTETQ